MATYTVTLYGNRRGALISADYLVSETSDYKEAKTRIKANGGWGSIGEQSSKERAIQDNDDFIINNKIITTNYQSNKSLNSPSEFAF